MKRPRAVWQLTFSATGGLLGVEAEVSWGALSGASDASEIWCIDGIVPYGYVQLECSRLGWDNTRDAMCRANGYN